MELFIEKGCSITETINVSEVMGKRVLAKSGTILGRVKEIRLNASSQDFEGVIVGSLLRKTHYISKQYIKQVTPEAVVLSIEPATVFIGRPAISSDGKKFGMVKAVTRVKETNRIQSLIIDIGWFRTAIILSSEVEQWGTSIMLRKTYDRLKHDRTS